MCPPNWKCRQVTAARVQVSPPAFNCFNKTRGYLLPWGDYVAETQIMSWQWQRSETSSHIWHRAAVTYSAYSEILVCFHKLNAYKHKHPTAHSCVKTSCQCVFLRSISSSILLWNAAIFFTSFQEWAISICRLYHKKRYNTVIHFLETQLQTVTQIVFVNETPDKSRCVITLMQQSC